MGDRRRVAVVFGGRSSEHAISCVTAAGVLQAIDRALWEVVAIGITREGSWVLASDDPQRWQLRDGVLPAVTAADGPLVLLPQEPGGTITVRSASEGPGGLQVRDPGDIPSELAGVDVVFPVLHGPFGEDGTIQGLLELSGTRYVGNGVLASALCMDKHYFKIVMAAAGVPIGPYAVVLPHEWPATQAQVEARVAELGYPVFVKPARAGSSMGVSRADSPAELAAAIDAAREHDPKVLVEAAIVGREIETAVLGDAATAQASHPGEIEVIGGHEFYDFEAKYLDADSVRLSCPAELPDEVAKAVQEVALRAYAAAGCEGLARVDSFVTPEGAVVLNEINTMPGFTPTSMYPHMWQQTGITYPELVERLLQLALDRPVGLR